MSYMHCHTFFEACVFPCFFTSPAYMKRTAKENQPVLYSKTECSWRTTQYVDGQW